MSDKPENIQSGYHYCSRCQRVLKDDNFFTYKNGEKCEMCKACLTAHLNNFEPDTFVWILEKFDVPYIEGEWNSLRDKAYNRDPYKFNGLSVLGRYLSKMKLNQFKNYGFKDSEELAKQGRIQKERQDREQQEKLESVKAAFEAGEITESQYLTYVDTTTKQHEDFLKSVREGGTPPIELSSLEDQLTIDDKLYLTSKWGNFYSYDDMIWLERKYNDFCGSFDIDSAARKDTLLLVCKTSLKMNEAINSNDIDSYQKLSRVYDGLMKSGKFQESQNKDKEQTGLSSIGELVYICEKEGGRIPRLKIEVPQDTVDTILEDNKNYLANLIQGDATMATQWEQFLRRHDNIAAAKEEEELRKRDKLSSDSDSYIYQGMENDDYTEQMEMIMEGLKRDNEW